MPNLLFNLYKEENFIGEGTHVIKKMRAEGVFWTRNCKGGEGGMEGEV